ncbi:helix-turn-helix domain-containing protein [Oerskovia sp. M15]
MAHRDARHLQRSRTTHGPRPRGRRTDGSRPSPRTHPRRPRRRPSPRPHRRPTHRHDPDRINAARVALADGQSRAAVARAIGVSRDTLYRHLADLETVAALPGIGKAVPARPPLP